MFFLFRSTLCIGLVTAALPQLPDLGHGPRQASGAPSLEALGRYCRNNPVRCRLAVETTIEAVGEAVPAAERTRPGPAETGAARS